VPFDIAGHDVMDAPDISENVFAGRIERPNIPGLVMSPPKPLALLIIPVAAA
jgi:hypothetical protein